VAIRTCPLCEATCGLSIRMGPDGEVLEVRGDSEDVFSRGYLCPKGASLGQVEDDPDRLVAPLVREDGELVPTDWDTAFARVAELVAPIVAADGPDAIAAYIGNPTGHNVAYPLYQGELLKALGSKQIYAASTMDQMPQQVVARLLFGATGSIGVPDLDRTDLLLVVGGNPLVSNGSLTTAPDWRRRLRSLRERGGTLVVIDPATTLTARAADLHVAPRPGTDALLLTAVVHVLFRDGLADPGAVADQLSGVAEVAAAVRPFTPERVAPRCGVDEAAIAEIAHRVAAARSAAVYGRLGTTLNAFGTLTTWALQLIGILTGNLDRPGGTMFATPAAGSPTTRPPSRGKPAAFGAWRTRVRGFPEILGELPVACFAEEVLTPGEGRLRGLIALAGNPARSFPRSAEVERALDALDVLICVDPYLNETTSRADIVLPPPGALTREHFDLVLYQYAVRNVANYSPPVRPVPGGMIEEWRLLLRLAEAVGGTVTDVDTDALDDRLAERVARRAARAQDLPEDDVVAALRGRGPSRLVDLRLRTGPYGDGFGRRPGGLTLQSLLDAPHGIDLGPLTSRLEHAVRTPSGTVELAHPVLVADLDRLRDELDREPAADLLLIGRRDLRSKNSWLHNVPALAKGAPRSALHLNPKDAAERGIDDGDRVQVSSASGSVTAPVAVTDAVTQGVCSLPHGWGHDEPGSRLRVASRAPGTNANVLTGDEVLDPLSGTVALNAVEVEVELLAEAPSAGR
jgi:anaerobic selenocysteine-containing dehydrogenase